MKEVVPGYYEFNGEILSYWIAAGFSFVEEITLPDPEIFGMETVFALIPIAEVLSGIHDHYTIDSDDIKRSAEGDIDLVMYVVSAEHVPQSTG